MRWLAVQLGLHSPLADAQLAWLMNHHSAKWLNATGEGSWKSRTEVRNNDRDTRKEPDDDDEVGHGRFRSILDQSGIAARQG